MKNWKAKVYHAKIGRDFKSKNWLRKRKRVFKRDRYQCQMCKSFYGEDGLMLTPHHLLPRAKGGKDKLTNLITLCWRCHNTAELEELNKYEILSYKTDEDNFFHIPSSSDKNWRKWVYGGFAKPSN